MNNIYKVCIKKSFKDTNVEVFNYVDVMRQWLSDNVGMKMGSSPTYLYTNEGGKYQGLCSRLASITDMTGIDVKIISEDWGSKWRLFSTYENNVDGINQNSVYICLYSEVIGVQLKLSEMI
jgi:hypothetical protein